MLVSAVLLRVCLEGGFDSSFDARLGGGAPLLRLTVELRAVEESVRMASMCALTPGLGRRQFFPVRDYRQGACEFGSGDVWSSCILRIDVC